MNKTTEALKLAEEALNAMLTHMGMDEDEWTKPTFNQAREALAAIREALAEHPMDYDQGFVDGVEAQLADPVKQEPVGYTAQSVIDWLVSDERTDAAYSGINLYKTPTGNSTIPLYAAPVSAPKQEPVAVISESAIGLVKLHSNGACLPFGTQLYAAPVSAPKQEPVAWAYFDADGTFMDALDRQHGAYQTPLHAAPVDAKREWVELTDDEICIASEIDGSDEWFYTAIHKTIAAFKEKNSV